MKPKDSLEDGEGVKKEIQNPLTSPPVIKLKEKKKKKKKDELFQVSKTVFA